REDEDKLDEAIQHYQAALSLMPDYPEALNNLGSACLAKDRYDLTIQYCGQALALKPDYPEAHSNIASAYYHQEQIDKALEHAQRAIELKPDHALAHHTLGQIKLSQGEVDEAVAIFEKAAELGHGDQEGFVMAYCSLASTRRFASRDDPLVQKIQELLESPKLTEKQKANLHFALGKVLDDVGAYEEAFKHYAEGNRLSPHAFDPKAHREHVDRIIRVFDRGFFEARRGWGVEDELPVFIVGMPRSGTTLTEQILSSHPQVHGAGELEDLVKMALGLEGQTGEAFPEGVARLEAEQVQALALGHLQRLRAKGGEALRVTDKMPSNFMRLGLIALLFPKAKIIHCMRHPLDTCLSCYFQNFKEGAQPFAYDLEHLGSVYKDYQRLMAHWKEVLPLPIFEVAYERLVEDTEGVSRAMVEFVGLPWDEACLAYRKNKRPVRTASIWQVRQPIYKRSLARWQRYEPFIAPLKK
ncbi:MAG: sulfotransferase family protein, partial [Gammaproteobacteria bacterium]